MKKQVVAGLMVAVAMVSFGCSGRNAEFGVVDMKAVESKAEIVKTVKEEVATKGKALQEEMTKEYFKQESTTSPERLKVLEADAKMRLCTIHHLAPENVDVSGHETSPGTYTFTVTERIPVSTFTIPTN